MSVLVGFSRTPEGMAALERAVGEARLRASDLSIMVSQPRPATVVVAAGDPVVPPEPVTAEELDAALDELGAGDLNREVRDADPLLDLADQMLELAEGTRVELIVIGLRRRSPVGKLFLGSSAQRIMLEASCPVLAVKADPHRGGQAQQPVAAETA